MEIRWDIFFIIVGAAAVTIIPRVLPLMVLSRVPLPKWGERWLSYVPVSVMAALAGQEVLMPNGELSLSWSNAELLAALPTILIAVKTRSLLATVLAGVISLMALRNLLV